jgi:lipopolysaccharide/colanic/teichoic acid biosynthesis glycosyltransferase
VSVPQTGERAWAAGLGERSVRVSVGQANPLASTVSVPQTGERAWAAGLGERSARVSPGHVNAPASRVSVSPGHVNAPAGTLSVSQDAVSLPRMAGPGRAALPVSTGRVAAVVAMPVADLMALVAAVAVTGLLGGIRGWLVLGYAAAVFLVLSAIGLQRLRICLRVGDQSGRIILAAAVPALAVAPWITATHAVALAAGTAGLLLGTRMAASAVLRSAHRHGRLTERAVLVGAGPEGRQLATLLDEHPELGLRPVGFLDHTPGDGSTSAPVQWLPVVGAVSDLGALVAREGVSRVIVCDPAAPDAELASALRASRPQAADVCVLPRLPGLGAAVPVACLDEVWGVPLIPLRRSSLAGPAPLGRMLKRSFDVLVAAVLLVLAAPLLGVTALAVRLTLRRPALFRQVRVVGQGALAEIVKLRTLGRHGDPDTSWTVPAGQCGALGRSLRVTHIDELPQLVSVLRGDMSLVGPRPERPHFVRQFSQSVPGYTGRQRMPAGMTGWSQVHRLNGDTSISDRARFDNYYIEYWSFWLDLAVLARTVTSIAAEAAATVSRAIRSYRLTGG